MSTIKNDKRIVLTLDAGGTNMVFAAMKGGEYVGEPLSLASNASELDACLNTIVAGFYMVKENLAKADENEPVAISFAFPGPADYPNGIIGGYLPNFPSFRDGVALDHSYPRNLVYRYISIMMEIFMLMVRHLVVYFLK